MLTPEVQQKLIRETINSAVCIDNEYVAAYSGNAGDANYADSKQLYESFRDSGKCHLDIYTFTNMADYQRDKEKLLRNRDFPSPFPSLIFFCIIFRITDLSEVVGQSFLCQKHEK